MDNLEYNQKYFSKYELWKMAQIVLGMEKWF
jgi:hypothetical protein